MIYLFLWNIVIEFLILVYVLWGMGGSVEAELSLRHEHKHTLHVHEEGVRVY